MDRWLRLFHRLPMSWLAFSLGMLIFLLTHSFPEADWTREPTPQSLVDIAAIEGLRDSPGQYSLIGGTHRQTMGAHMLPQYLRAFLAPMAGGADRAGLWLSLVGVLATLAGIYALSRRILPLRGFCLITLVAVAGVGTVHYAVDPDPSIAMGMGLVMWGFAFFCSSLERSLPYRALWAAVCFGLAGWIRVELSMLQVICTIYLIILSINSTAHQKSGMPLVAMGVGGLVVMAIIFWPMIHVNMVVAKTPILPGPDARLILGAPTHGGRFGLPFFSHLIGGFGVLTFDEIGPGVFAGLLWPLGMMISLFTSREKAMPFFWLPLIVSSVVLLTLVSFVTGWESYRESLQMVTPILMPFAVLPVVYAVFLWFQQQPREWEVSRKVWIVTALAVYSMMQIPHGIRQVLKGFNEESLPEEQLTWAEGFSALDDDLQSQPVLTDMPGVLLAAGQRQVFGVGGETDWYIHSTKYANGHLNPEKLLNYLNRNKIGLVHLSDPQRQDVLEKMARLLEEEEEPDSLRITSLEPITGHFPSPHRVYWVRYLDSEEP